MGAPDVGQISDFLQRHGIAVLLLLVVAVVVYRAIRPIVHRALVRVLRARGPVAPDSELTGDEVAKRVATIEDLVSTVLGITVILVTVRGRRPRGCRRIRWGQEYDLRSGPGSRRLSRASWLAGRPAA